MAAAMASLSLAAAVPVVSSSVGVGSVAHFGGVKLNIATPRVSRSSRMFVIRAEDKKNPLDGLKDAVSGAFGNAQKKTDDAASQSKAELNKASSQAKGSSGDLQSKAAGLKDDLQAQAEEASEKVKSGIEDLKGKVQDATDSAKK